MPKKRRRQWTDDEKISIVGQTRIAGVSVAQVARRYALNANQIHQWIRNPRFNPIRVEDQEPVFFPVELSSPAITEGSVIEHVPAGSHSSSPTAPRITITATCGVQIDIRDCSDAEMICQIVRGLS